MGKHTIAEFVGDQETVEVLTRLGVDYGQGYFLGRPETLDSHLAAHPHQRPQPPPPRAPTPPCHLKLPGRFAPPPAPPASERRRAPQVTASSARRSLRRVRRR